MCFGQFLDNSVVPFVRCYLKRVLEVFHPTKPWFEKYRYHASERHHPNGETWVMFESRYGLTRRDEIEYNEWLQRWDGSPAFGSHWCVERMVARDL
jgi:hypothetical protein